MKYSISSPFRAICCLMIFCLSFLLGHAQSPASTGKDLIKKIQETPADTSRIHALLEYSSWLIDYNKDSSIKVAQQALSLSQQLSYRFGEGRSHNLQGVAYAEKGDYKQALIAYTKAIELFQSIQDHFQLGRVYNNRGNVHNNQGRLEAAAEDYFNAIRYLELTNELVTYQVYNNFAIALRKLNQLDKAVHYSIIGQEQARKAKDTIRLVQLLTTSSDALMQGGHFKESVRYSREAVQLSTIVDYSVGKTVALLNLADFQLHTNRYDSALYYLNQAKTLAHQVGDPVYIEEVYYALGKIQFALKQYKPAYQNLLHSLFVAQQSKDQEHLAKTYNLLSAYYSSQGLYEKSLEAFRQSKAYDDSLRSESVTRNIQFLETKYRTSEKDKEIAQNQLALIQKNAELETKNSMIWLSLIGLISLTVVIVLGYRNYRQKQKLQAQQIFTLQKENEAKALNALIKGEEKERIRIARDLHDGVGSILSALKMYLSSLSTEFKAVASSITYQEATSLLVEAVSEVRRTAHNLMPQVLHQQGLEEAARSFCEKINKGNALQVEFQSYGLNQQRFPADFELMVYRLVQELLHNTLRHAQANHALVQLSLNNKVLAITVEDDGKGFDLEQLSPDSGIGLQTMRSRVQAFNGIIDFESAEGRGTMVYIEFNVEKIPTVCV